MSHSRLLAELTPATVDAFVALADPAVTVLELRHLGGALRHPAEPGAAGPVEAEALLFASGVPATAEHALALDATFAAIDTLRRPADRRTLLTFDERGDGAALPAAVTERLRAITRAYDPGNLLGARPRI